MKNSIIKKGLVLAIIVLFIGSSIIPSIGKNIKDINDKSVEGEITRSDLKMNTPKESSRGILFSDDFNDGNNDGWTVYQGDWQVVNGEYAYNYNGLSNIDGITTAGDSGWSNYIYECKFRITEGYLDYPQVYFDFRFGAYAGYNIYQAYSFMYDPATDRWSLFVFSISGGETFIAYESNPSYINLNQWYTVKIEAFGSHINCYVDNVLKIDVYDTTYTTGKIGLRGDVTKIFFDDILVTDDNYMPIANAGGPYNGKVGQTILLDATQSNDPDGDDLYYRWDFTNDTVWDTPWNTNPTQIWTYNNPIQGTVRVEVKDSSNSTDNATASINILTNNPPNIPTNPSPQHESIDIDEETDLSWTGGDPDNDLVNYDVYFGKTNPPPLKSIGLTSPYYNPGLLEDLTTFYWQVNATDKYGESSLGPVWEFTTIYENDPPVKPKKPMGPQSCIKDVFYTYTTSVNDPEQDQVYYQTHALFSQYPPLVPPPSQFDEWIGPFNSGETYNFSYTFQQTTDYGYFYWLRIRAKDEHDNIGPWSWPLGISVYETNAYPEAEIISIEPLDIHTSELFTLKANYSDPEGDPAVRCCWYIFPIDNLLDKRVIYEGPYQETIQKYHTGLEPNKLYTIGFAVTDRTPSNDYWFKYAPFQDSSGPYLVWDYLAYGDVPGYPHCNHENHSVGPAVNAYSGCNCNTGAVSACFVNWIGGTDAWAQMEPVSFTIPRTLNLVGLEAGIAHLSGHFSFAASGEAMKFQLKLYKKNGSKWVYQDEISDIHWISRGFDALEIFKNIIVDKFLIKWFFPTWYGTIFDAVGKFCTISEMLELGGKLRAFEYTNFDTARLILNKLNPGTYKIVPLLAGGGVGLAYGASTAVTYGQITHVMIRELTASEYYDWEGVFPPTERNSDIFNFNIHSRGPADITVVDPQDNILNKNVSDILYAYYDEGDVDGDGNMDDFLSIPYAINGTYEIFITPDVNASVNDTLNVSIMSSAGNHSYLIENVTIGNITSTPYLYNVQSSNIPFIKIKHFDTFRISNDSLLIEWSAFDPDDGYNLPISLYVSGSSDGNWSLIESDYPNTGQYLYDISYLNNSLYRFKILTNDTDGNFRFALSEYCQIVNRTEQISNIAPSANFSYDPMYPSEMDVIEFNDTSFDRDGNITNWTWDFGDGNISFLQHPTYIYTSIGNHTVNLSVFDDKGSTDKISKVINVRKKVHITNLSSEWNFVSLPFNQSVNNADLIIRYNSYNYTWQEAVNNSIILGFIYEWNRTNQNYELVDTLNPGFGCWMYAYEGCGLWAEGVRNITEDNFVTDLLSTWNIVGLPDEEPVNKENLTVYYNETEYTWQEAVNDSIILGFIYEWNETNQNYEYTDILKPGKGCWMYAYYNCTLLRPET